MNTNYEIVEYINPCFPDRLMYKCTMGNVTYHTNDRAKLVNWANDQVVNVDIYIKQKELNHLACEAFYK